MTQAVKVEYEELMARADELEQPIPPMPSSNPKPPCGLSFVADAATQIGMNADTLRSTILSAQREWNTLAKSLRKAAKAYQDVDEGSADDIDAVNMDGTSGSSPTGGGGVSVNTDPDYLPSAPQSP